MAMERHPAPAAGLPRLTFNAARLDPSDVIPRRCGMSSFLSLARQYTVSEEDGMNGI